jgi:hypothetical protein
MNLRTGCFILLGAVMMPAAAMAAGTTMKEGLWEITTTMEMPGMPYQLPPTTYSHCYTKEDLKDEKQALPKQQGDCKVTDMKRHGSKVTWKVVCTGENKGTGEGEIVFQGDTAYDGSMKFDMEQMKMTSRYKARRVGECAQR